MDNIVDSTENQDEIENFEISKNGTDMKLFIQDLLRIHYRMTDLLQLLGLPFEGLLDNINHLLNNDYDLYLTDTFGALDTDSETYKKIIVLKEVLANDL